MPAPGCFDRNLQRDALLRLDAQDQQIGRGISSPSSSEHGMRSGVELDRDFGHALGQLLAGADVKRHAGPAPVVDEESRGGVGIGLRVGIDAGLLPESGHVLAADARRPVLPGDGVAGTSSGFRMRIERSSLARSSRTASGSNTPLGSMATVAITCSR